MTDANKTSKVMANKNEATKVANVETTKVAIESETEMTASQVINAYLANHAVEHYCAAMGADTESVKKVLDSCAKEAGVHWLYTCPAIDGKKSDGTKLPTKEEWKGSNPEAVEIGMINGKCWFKRPFIIGDARGVRSVFNAFENYMNAKQGAKEREAAKIAAAAAVLGVDVETLLALRK